MTLRSITCLFGGDETELAALHTGFRIAASSTARLRIVHAFMPPQVEADYFGGVMTPAGETWWEHVERRNAKALEEARAHATRLSEEYRVGLDEATPAVHHASATFEAFERTVGAPLAPRIALSDLIIVGHGPGDPFLATDSVPGVALLGTDRPVLFVPGNESAPETVWKSRMAAIAWNGSPEAMRAVLHAAALLEGAESAHILRVAEDGVSGSSDIDDHLARYLEARGVKNTLTVLKRGKQSVSDALLGRVAELGCDYLVMGAYSHSVFREMLMGGVTADILKKAAVPLLLNH